MQRFVKFAIPFICCIALFAVVFSLPATVSADVECIDLTTGAKQTERGANAVCPSGQCQVGKLCNPTRYGDLNAFLLIAVVGVAVQYGLLLIVFFLVLAGFKFVVAQGNPEKISDAKKMLVWVVVGAFVLLGVYVIRAAVCGTIDAIKPAGLPSTCQ